MKIIDITRPVAGTSIDWRAILARPAIDTRSLELSVTNILREVKEEGDEAVRRFSQMFDKVSPDSLEVGETEIAAAGSMLSGELKEAIGLAKRNIEAFHAAQAQVPERMETMPGVACWRRSVAIEKVGLYIPGGTAPLFSTLLMLGVPAGIAGCREIVLCSPPDRQGRLHPAILYAARLVGVTRIFRAGGVQAIAAMAYGTDTIPRVYKIFGPGNQYVTCAKQLVQKDGLAIDMPAGPSEVAVYADETADPVFTAADLLSQAEHGVDSQVILVSAIVEGGRSHPGSGCRSAGNPSPCGDRPGQALENSRAILVKDEEQAMELLNEYAPEHLILACGRIRRNWESVYFNAGLRLSRAFLPRERRRLCQRHQSCAAYQRVCPGI